MSTNSETYALLQFQGENYRQIFKQYNVDSLIIAFSPVLYWQPTDISRLLRHHDDEEISDGKEIVLREVLDRLLHFCSVVEIGFQSGSVDASAQDLRQIAQILKHKEVQEYYRVRYPIELPGRLLERLSGQSSTFSLFAPNWFADLLMLDQNFRDPRLAAFLMIVDGFWIGDINLETVKACVKHRDLIVESIVTPRENRSALQEVMSGIERFLIFSDELNALIEKAPSALLAEGCLSLYKYWYVARKDELEQVILQVLETISENAELTEAKVLPSREAVSKLFLRARKPEDYH